MSKKGSVKQGELVFGINPIVELLTAKKRKLTVIYTTKPQPKMWPKIEKLLPKGMQIQYVAKDVLTKMAGTTDHQSVVAWATPLEIRKKFFDPKESPVIVMLDGIQDPRNLGAILRTAYCTGVDGVVLISRGASPLTAVALKASAGLVEHVPVYYAPSSANAIQLIDQAGYSIYISVLSSKAESAYGINYKQPLCIVIGSEGVGVSRDILPFGKHVMLPQRNVDISYNASVAAGILLFMVGIQTGKIA
jgi:23S rRNA (guanosine2251-2'-O)-methyltransferase